MAFVFIVSGNTENYGVRVTVRRYDVRDCHIVSALKTKRRGSDNYRTPGIKHWKQWFIDILGSECRKLEQHPLHVTDPVYNRVGFTTYSQPARRDRDGRKIQKS